MAPVHKLFCHRWSVMATTLQQQLKEHLLLAMRLMLSLAHMYPIASSALSPVSISIE